MNLERIGSARCLVSLVDLQLTQWNDFKVLIAALFFVTIECCCRAFLLDLAGITVKLCITKSDAWRLRFHISQGQSYRSLSRRSERGLLFGCGRRSLPREIVWGLLDVGELKNAVVVVHALTVGRKKKPFRKSKKAGKLKP